MELGIVGLPYSGKTTLFETLTGQEVTTQAGGGRVEVHRGVVKVPDPRLDRLTEIFKPQKKVPASIEYVEVGGLQKEASKGKGFDTQFLAVLKTTDAICLVVRAFESDIYPHPEGSIDVLRDIEIVETEFILSDMSIVENRISRLEKDVIRAKTDENLRELELMRHCQQILESEKPLREYEFSAEESRKLRGYQFLSAKPLLIVVNYREEDIPDEENILSQLSSYLEREKIDFTGLSAHVELEISQLEASERDLFLSELGISEPAAHKLIRKSYDLLGLISFFTFGSDECRAWTIPENTTAQKAAGTIHSDLERGFIRAEVVHYDDFMEMGSMAKCREKGVLRLEGKDYIVKDGDMITIRFNV